MAKTKSQDCHNRTTPEQKRRIYSNDQSIINLMHEQFEQCTHIFPVSEVLSYTSEINGVLRLDPKQEKFNASILLQRILDDMIYDSGFSVQFFRDTRW